jgi:TPR repeat protein
MTSKKPFKTPNPGPDVFLMKLTSILQNTLLLFAAVASAFCFEMPSAAQNSLEVLPATAVTNKTRTAIVGDAAEEYSRWSRIYYDDTSTADQVREACTWLKQSASQGFPAAEYDLALNYLGQAKWGVLKLDQQEGLDLLKRAADNEWPPAECKLGMLYAIGELLPPDQVKAVEYLRMAADKGDPRAKYELAGLYAAGVGEPRGANDTPIALLDESSASGYSAALFALGERYRNGLGVPMDFVRSIRYYQATRDAENRDGNDTQKEDKIFNLVDENLQPRSDVMLSWIPFARVLSVYLRAARNSDAEAMNQLGQWYADGYYEPQDPVAAYHWFNLAAESGSDVGIKNRDMMKTRLTPDQVKQAEMLGKNGP